MIVTASMKPVLQAIEPRALPKAISGFPLMALLAETMASGSVVHRLTMVAPMIRLGIFNTFASQIVASINQSLPLTINKKPMKNIRNGVALSMDSPPKFHLILLYTHPNGKTNK